MGRKRTGDVGFSCSMFGMLDTMVQVDKIVPLTESSGRAIHMNMRTM